MTVPVMQAAIKTIGEEDKYFSRVSLRLETILTFLCSIWPYSRFSQLSNIFYFYEKYMLNRFHASLRMLSYGITVKSSKVDLPKPKAYVDGNSGVAHLSTSSDVSLDGWDGIALEYSVDWPLQLFFTQEVLSK